MTEVRILGPEYDGAEQSLGNLADKLQTILFDSAREDRGRFALPEPSMIEITPIILVDEPAFVLSAWHETEGASPGRHQCHEVTLRPLLEGEDAFLQADNTNNQYVLTTREAFFIRGLADLALANLIQSQT